VETLLVAEAEAEAVLKEESFGLPFQIFHLLFRQTQFLLTVMVLALEVLEEAKVEVAASVEVEAKELVVPLEFLCGIMDLTV